MLHLSLSIFVVQDGQPLPTQIKDAASALFQQCLNSPLLDASDKREIARDAARMGSWEAWGMVGATLENGSGILSSLDSIEKALADTDHRGHKVALSAVRTALQDSGSTIEYVTHAVGAHVLNLLKRNGLNADDTDRLTVFADAMRILMLSFQNLVEKGDDSLLIPFLTILFAVFVRIIEFNGLPNHHAANPSGDPSLGRMCAQAIVHTVRVSPAAFKGSMVSLSAEDRGVLEMAVRAEMSGYAVAPAANSASKKKKLSLKGFSKA